MYEISTMNMAFEQCTKDKERINIVVPYTVLHFVLSGEGFINGNKISEDTVFISYKDTPIHYYPSDENPWSYVYIRLLGQDMKKVFEDYNFQHGLTILPFQKKKELLNILSLYEALCTYDDYDARRTIANTVLLLFEKKSEPADNCRLTKTKCENYKTIY